MWLTHQARNWVYCQTVWWNCMSSLSVYCKDVGNCWGNVQESAIWVCVLVNDNVNLSVFPQAQVSLC